MCFATQTVPALACTIGDLKVGQQFHDPNGERWMVVGPVMPANYRAQFDQNGKQVADVMVVNLGNGVNNRFGMKGDELRGTVTPMYADVCLGYDHRGNLYASTALNDWYDYQPAPVPAYDDNIDPNMAARDDNAPGLSIDDAV